MFAYLDFQKFVIFLKRRTPKHPEDPYSPKSWRWDQYLSKNTNEILLTWHQYLLQNIKWDFEICEFEKFGTLKTTGHQQMKYVFAFVNYCGQKIASHKVFIKRGFNNGGILEISGI